MSVQRRELQCTTLHTETTIVCIPQCCGSQCKYNDVYCNLQQFTWVPQRLPLKFIVVYGGSTPIHTVFYCKLQPEHNDI